MSKAYLKGYKSALSNLGEVISESHTKNDAIARLHRETEWVNEALAQEEEKDRAWEALLATLDNNFSMVQINLQKEGME